VSKELFPELEKRFIKVMSIKDYDVDNIVEGRSYIESYGQFFKFTEEEQKNHHVVHQEGTSQTGHQH
jgi:hypothetical protein